MIIARVREFFSFFICIFCLANFVIGTVGYIFATDKISPVPDLGTMGVLGVLSAIIAFCGFFYEP